MQPGVEWPLMSNTIPYRFTNYVSSRLNPLQVALRVHAGLIGLLYAKGKQSKDEANVDGAEIYWLW